MPEIAFIPKQTQNWFCFISMLEKLYQTKTIMVIVVVRLETAYRLGAGGYSRIQDPEERKADYRGDLH